MVPHVCEEPLYSATDIAALRYICVWVWDNMSADSKVRYTDQRGIKFVLIYQTINTNQKNFVNATDYAKKEWKYV